MRMAGRGWRMARALAQRVAGRGWRMARALAQRVADGGWRVAGRRGCALAPDCRPWSPDGAIAPRTYSLQPTAYSLCALLLAPAAALAHAETGAASGFLSGLSHPISGLDHVVAMIAVGLWGAQLGPPAIWALPVAFPLMMAVGGFLGLIGMPLPGVEIGIALSAVLLGAMVLLEARPPLPAAVALVAFFAIFHGHAHGSELPPGESGLTYSIGFVIATGLLHAVGIGIGLIHRWSAGQLALRGAGALVAAAGAYFLWGAIA
jgi:urease accessory protein